MADNTVLSTAVGSGDTIRSFDDGAEKWTASVCCYAVTISPGANVLQAVTAANPLPITAASLPLPSGASTSALQTTGNSSLSTIATNTPALGQALAAASVPVVLTAAQLTTLTPLTTVGVTGTFWQATQPVSAASLPLPTGAAAAAKQPALGTAGSASADVITVQGIASMTPLLATVTFASAQAVTQSGTWTVAIAAAQTIAVTNAGTFAVQATIGAGSNVIGHVIVDSGVCQVTNAGTFAVQATLAAETTKVIGTVNIASAQTVGLAAGSQVIGHVIVDSGNITTVSAVTAITNALPAGTNLLGKTGIDQTTIGTTNGVTQVPCTTGGCSMYSVNSSGAANQDAAAIKASAGQLYGYSLFNTTSSARYVKLYNLASGATSASTPFMRIYLPPTGGANMPVGDSGVAMGTGISIRLTTGAADNDTGACSANDVLANIIYK